MRDMTAGFRNAALATDRKPTTAVKLRRRYPDFGGQYAIALSGMADDMYDIEGECAPTDSAQSTIGEKEIARVTHWAASQASSIAYFSCGTPTGDLSVFDDQALVTGTWNVATHSRVGICFDTDQFYAVYVNISNDIKMRSSYDGLSWSSAVTVEEDGVTGWDGIAFAPISSSEFFVCYLIGPRMFVSRWTLNGTWSHTTPYCVAIDESFGWEDAQWFDAEIDPTSSSRRVIVYTTTASCAASRIYSGGYYSEPYMLIPSDQEYVYQTMRVSGLNTIDGRLWALCKRGLRSTDDIVYTPYTTILHSADGKYWTVYAAVGAQECRGKLYATDSRVLAMGAAVVMQSEATSLLGTVTELDVSGEVNRWSYQFSESVPGEITTILSNPATPTALQAGMEILHYYGVGGQSNQLISTQTLDGPGHRLANNLNQWELVSRGPLKALDNMQSADGLYAGGFGRFYDFQIPEMVSVAGDWGTFSPYWTDETYFTATGTISPTGAGGDGSLIEGLAITSYGINANFVARCHLYCPRYAAPAYIAFWYEDEEDYWRFGWNGTNFVIQQIVGGQTVTREVAGGAGAIVADTEYRLMVQMDGHKVYGYFWNGTWALKCTYEHALDTYPGRAPLGLVAVPQEDERVFFGWFYFREAAHDWTRGRLIQAVCAQAGLDLTVPLAFDGASPTGAGFTSIGSGYYMTDVQQREVDLEAVVSPLSGGTLGIVIGATSNTSPSNLSGWMVRIESDKISLQCITSGSLDEREYIPFTFPATGARVRLTVYKGQDIGEESFFNLWVRGKFVAGFAVGHAEDAYKGAVPEEGYIGVYATGAATTSSFEIMSLPEFSCWDSYTWQRGAPASGVVSEILRGSFWRLIEQADDTAVLQELGDDLSAAIAAYKHVLVSYIGIESDREWASIIRVSGAEIYVDYVHAPLLRRGERSVDIDMDVLYSEEDCMNHAIKVGRYMESAVNGREVVGHIDPALLPGDLFTIDAEVGGSEYKGIVSSGSFSVADNQGQMTVRARAQDVVRETLTWGVSNWDEGVWA